jgi:hypothetical protein
MVPCSITPAVVVVVYVRSNVVPVGMPLLDQLNVYTSVESSALCVPIVIEAPALS